MVHSRLKLREPGPGYCHFPVGHGYDPHYFQQLTSMKSVIRYVKGVPRREWVVLSGRRNEAFDCRMYALAALYILNPIWSAVARRRETKLQASQEPIKPVQNPIRRRRSNWVTDWRTTRHRW